MKNNINKKSKGILGIEHPFLWIGTILVIPSLVLAGMNYDSPVLFIIGTVELILIAIVVTTFVIVYSRRNWNANPYGRALMYSKISLAILANLSLITIFFGPEWPGRAALRFLLFGLILFAQSRLLHLLVITNYTTEREEYQKREEV